MTGFDFNVNFLQQEDKENRVCKYNWIIPKFDFIELWTTQ